MRQDAEHLKSAVARYEAGETCAEIAPSLGCTPSHAHTLLVAAGVKMRRGGGRVGLKPDPAVVARRAASNRRPLRGRFLAKVAKDANTGCWLWQGSHDRRGYGQIRVDGRCTYATHVALKLFKGAIVPDGMFACHHCDTPSCVNPDHLFVGTPKQNVADMVAKGRGDFSGLAHGHGWNRGKRRQPEYELQKAVVQVLRLSAAPGIFWAAIPNGEYRHDRTAARLKAMGVIAGSPDMFLIVAGIAHGIELKAPGGRQSPEQKAVEAAWNRAGGFYHLVTGIDSALAVLREIGALSSRRAPAERRAA